MLPLHVTCTLLVSLWQLQSLCAHPASEAAVAAALPAATAAKGEHDSVPHQFESLWTPTERAAYCETAPHLQPLYLAIEKDLQRWSATGIDLQLMSAAVEKHTLRGNSPTRKGFFIGFRNGTAVLPDGVHLQRNVGHHSAIFFLYMQVMVDLQELFGNLIPDVDFIINTFDCPGLLVRKGQTPLPVMRFAKSPATADILIPNFHMYSTKHNQEIDLASKAMTQYPWAERKPVLFARFTYFERYRLARDPYTQRQGVNNASLCKPTGHSYGASMLCHVREHFAQWSGQFRPRLDIASNPRIPLLKHAAYKYLAHVDGAGLSSKFDQLLALGSLILKEQSGYYGFYHHLLEPYKHYVPFWNKTPEDVLDALKWAEDNDEQARHIGQAGQQVAAQYLTREARACYWYKLLTAFSKLLQYKPAEAAGQQYWHFNKPIAQYLEEDAPLVRSKQGPWLKRLYDCLNSLDTAVKQNHSRIKVVQCALAAENVLSPLRGALQELALKHASSSLSRT